MWSNLEKPWQLAFNMAWEAYKSGTVPIGAVIVNTKGDVVSTGRNRILDKEGSAPLAGTNMAHAEIDAMFGLNEREHPDIRKYILYTTMEPCPMCFGTMVMMNIRNICYAARDGFAGATLLNDKLDYIKNENIIIKRGNAEMEAFQLILQSVYEYERQHPKIENLLNKWSKINKSSIEYGKVLFESRYFRKAIAENKGIDKIFDEVMEGYISRFM